MRNSSGAPRQPRAKTAGEKPDLAVGTARPARRAAAAETYKPARRTRYVVTPYRRGDDPEAFYPGIYVQSKFGRQARWNVIPALISTLTVSPLPPPPPMVRLGRNEPRPEGIASGPIETHGYVRYH